MTRLLYLTFHAFPVQFRFFLKDTDDELSPSGPTANGMNNEKEHPQILNLSKNTTSEQESIDWVSNTSGVASSEQSDGGSKWPCRFCTFLNQQKDVKCQICRRPRSNLQERETRQPRKAQRGHTQKSGSEKDRTDGKSNIKNDNGINGENEYVKNEVADNNDLKTNVSSGSSKIKKSRRMPSKKTSNCYDQNAIVMDSNSTQQRPKKRARNRSS